MQVLAVVRGDGEGLLHKPVWLISVAVRPTVGVILLLRLSVLDAITVGVLLEAAATTLALHFAICKKASRNSACAPGFAVCPSSHAGFALVPYKH